MKLNHWNINKSIKKYMDFVEFLWKFLNFGSMFWDNEKLSIIGGVATEDTSWLQLL